MSDSLRDQLLKAGFNAPKTPAASRRKPKARKRNRAERSASTAPTGRNSAVAAVDEQAARRKAIKAQIKELIETSACRDFKGESAYRFMVKQRIRELHVTDEIRAQLVAGTLIITRLNGSTWLVPSETADAIRALNPDWVLVTPAPDKPDDNQGYEEFPVPDDLQW